MQLINLPPSVDLFFRPHPWIIPPPATIPRRRLQASIAQRSKVRQWFRHWTRGFGSAVPHGGPQGDGDRLDEQVTREEYAISKMQKKLRSCNFSSPSTLLFFATEVVRMDRPASSQPCPPVFLACPSLLPGCQRMFVSFFIHAGVCLERTDLGRSVLGCIKEQIPSSTVVLFTTR